MSESTEKAVQKFDPNALTERLRDKIRLDIVELIPPEQWTRMLQAEVNRFFNERREPSYGYQSQRDVPSDFQAITRGVLAEECKKQIQAYFATPEWAAVWGAKPGEPGEWTYLASLKVQEMVRALAPDIVQAWIAQTIQSIVTGMTRQG